MSEEKIQPGDKIFHLTLDSVAWVVEKVEDDLVTCSTLVKGTLELKREKFTLNSVKKIEDRGSIAMIPTRRDVNLG